MNIDSFMVMNGIKSKRTVVNWIKRGYIPGADLQKDYVPDASRLPYTRARAKGSDSIYRSIVKAARDRKHVFAKLYGVTDNEFQGYIERLIDAGLIVTRVTDGVTYYDATLKAEEYTKINTTVILRLVEAASKGFAEGFVSGLDKMGGF